MQPIVNPVVIEEMIKKIKEKAEKTACTDNDDFNIDGYAGGNIDDAYSLGCDDGEILFARELLEMIED